MSNSYKIDSLELNGSEVNRSGRAMKDFFEFCDKYTTRPVGATYLNLFDFFSYYSVEEIESVRHDWAKLAYSLTLKSIIGEALNREQNKFLESYINSYIANHDNLNSVEKDFNKFYILHRLSKDYTFNRLASESINNKMSFEYGYGEFAKTLEMILKDTLNEKLDVKFDEVKSNYNYNLAKVTGKKLTIDAKLASDAYSKYIKNDDYNALFEVLQAAYIGIGIARLKQGSKKEVSEEALIYDMEDSLAKKAKTSNMYAEIEKYIVANKLLYINANKKCEKCFADILNSISNITYGETNEELKKFLAKVEASNATLKHLNDERDLPLLYEIYTNGLKSTPKTNVSKASSYVVLGGDKLPLFEIDNTIDNIVRKRDSAKSNLREVHYALLASEAKGIRYFALSNDPALTIEQLLYYNAITEETMNYAKTHRRAFNSLVETLKKMNEKYDTMASSNSPKKVGEILERSMKSESLLAKCYKLDEMCNHELTNYDLTKDIVISSYKDSSKNRLIALLQKMTGKGIVELERELNDGKVVIYDVSEKRRELVEKELISKGAHLLSQNKNK